MPYRGYAPGNYMNVCSSCGFTSLACDKRSYTCIECAFGGTPVFVFGSNLAGRHGKGAALFALNARGAITGQGSGRMGQSYGIPTVGQIMRRSLPLEEIALHVETFVKYARACSDELFQVTPIGCGLAGYSPAEIAPMFADAPDNCVMPFEFKGIIG